MHGSLQFMSCISLVGVDVKEVNYRKRKKSVPFSLIYDRFCMYFLFFRDLCFLVSGFISEGIGVGSVMIYLCRRGRLLVFPHLYVGTLTEKYF